MYEVKASFALNILYRVQNLPFTITYALKDI